MGLIALNLGIEDVRLSALSLDIQRYISVYSFRNEFFLRPFIRIHLVLSLHFNQTLSSYANYAQSVLAGFKAHYHRIIAPFGTSDCMDS